MAAIGETLPDPFTPYFVLSSYGESVTEGSRWFPRYVSLVYQERKKLSMIKKNTKFLTY